jgi:hypothetical protein
MDGQQPVDCLDLHDEGILYDEVEPVAAIERDALITQRHGTLPLDPQPAKLQFVGQAQLVRGFEQPRPEVSMHLNARAEDDF